VPHECYVTLQYNIRFVIYATVMAVNSEWSQLNVMLHVFVALSFIRTVEFPDLLRLRVEMLTENGCNELALNLVRWCLRCEIFHHDIMMRSHLLLLLLRIGDMSEFDNQVFSKCVLIT